MVKIGRRGSLNAKITVHGTQGHVAYPHRADNPVHRLVRVADCADRRAARRRQRLVRAIQPAVHQHRCRQFGDQRDPADGERDAEHPLQQRSHRRVTVSLAARWSLPSTPNASTSTSRSAAKSFLTEPGRWCDTLRQAIVDTTGVEPKLDTGGGTSDARFIARYCPVAEFGLVGATMHQVDERVPVAELHELGADLSRHSCGVPGMSGRRGGPSWPHRKHRVGHCAPRQRPTGRHAAVRGHT